MILQYAFLVVVALLAGGAALLAEKRKRIALASLAAAIAAIGIAYGVYQERAQRQAAEREYILSLAKEISAAQYVTIEALSKSDPELRSKIEEAFEDGHVIWSEYGPIEADAAMRLAGTARKSALEEIRKGSGVAAPQNRADPLP